MTAEQLAAEILYAKVMLRRLPPRELTKLILASPPAGPWSRILARMIRDELHHRELADIFTTLSPKAFAVTGSGL